MTSKRDLGLPLAYTGLGVVIAAVIAGFVAVGGPGDARDRRIDEMTLNRLHATAEAAQCAYSFIGKAQSSLGEIRTAISQAIKASPNRLACSAYTYDFMIETAEYNRVDDNHIRLCADFQRAHDPSSRQQTYRPTPSRFPELDAPHPKGRHCYEIELVPMEVHPPATVPLN